MIPAARRALHRLWSATIWAPDAIPASEGELARDVKRWVLPTFDLVLIGAAVLALYGGLPSLALVTARPIATVAAWALLVVVATCLVGVAFPKLWLVEFVGKCALIFMLLTYGLIALILAVIYDPNRSFMAGLSIATSVLPICRVVWLGRERRRRREGRRRAHLREVP